MHQMPVLGDMKSTNRRDIKQRLRAFRALLDSKDNQTKEVRKSQQEKNRAVAEQQELDKKCKDLQKNVDDLTEKNKQLQVTYNEKKWDPSPRVSPE